MAWHVFTMRDICNVWQAYLMFLVLRFYNTSVGADAGNVVTEMWTKNGFQEWRAILINDANCNILV